MKIKVKVKPNSKEQSIEKKEDYYLVKLKSVAKDNKANLELFKVLKKHFKTEVKIVRGLRGKNKVIELVD